MESSKPKAITLIWHDAEPPIDEPDHWAVFAPKLDIRIEGIEKPEEIYPILYAGLKFAERFFPNPQVHVHSADEDKPETE